MTDQVKTRTGLPLEEWSNRFLPEYFTQPPSRLHKWLFERHTRYHGERNQRDAVVAARRSAKTTIVAKANPLYCICERIERYILLLGDTQEAAEKNLMAIRAELEDNERIHNQYPELARKTRIWSNRKFVTSTGVTVEAMGRGAKIRGTTFRYLRPTMIVGDDLDDKETARSELQRKHIWDWLTGDVIPSGAKGCNVFLIGNALHRDDTLQKIRRTAGWTFRTFPAIVSWPENMALWRDWEAILASGATGVEDAVDRARLFYLENQAAMDAGSEVLWPEYEPLYDLMLLRAEIGHGAFMGEKQCDPTYALESLWPRECFGDHIWFDQWPELRTLVMACDPSGGKNETADYSAWVALGMGHDGLLYVDADLSRRDPLKICEDGFQWAERLQPKAIGIEANGFKAMIALWNKIAQVRRTVPLPPPVTIFNHAEKHERIRTDLTPWIRGGKFRFRSNSAGAQLLVDQLQEFPTGAFDDGPDCLQMALRLLQWLVHNTPDQSKSGTIAA